MFMVSEIISPTVQVYAGTRYYLSKGTYYFQRTSRKWRGAVPNERKKEN
jgi:hypothetical protein